MLSVKFTKLGRNNKPEGAFLLSGREAESWVKTLSECSKDWSIRLEAKTYRDVGVRVEDFQL